MQILETFDSAIALTEELERGYRIDDKVYSNYLANDEWDRWLADMSEDHRHQFDNGSGGELEPKNRKPPKMASFASSSRMIYRLSRDFPGFQFEKQLPTKVGGTANLDGYLEQENALIYVEAKCREPYSHTAIQLIRQKYKPLYLHLREKMPRVFSCVMEDIPDSRDMRVVFFCRGNVVQHFDIKQMICHMLGVANALLNSTNDKPVLFLYLLFNPSYLELPKGTATEILGIYEDTCRNANAFDFSEMFGHIVDYLIYDRKLTIDNVRIEEIKRAFRFVLTDQTDYRFYISE